MKIGNNIESIQSDLQTRAANGSRSGVASGKDVGAVEATDKVELSSTSRSLASGMPAGSAADTVRLEKVAEVKAAMQEGKFHVNAQVVAEKMISEAAELIEAIAGGAGPRR